MRFSNRVFLFWRDNVPFLWHADTHEQYELDKTAMNALRDASFPEIDSSPITSEIIAYMRAEGVLTDSDELETAWPWDILSELFHHGTRNIPIAEPGISDREWVEEYLAYCEEIGDPPPPPPRPHGQEVHLPKTDCAVLNEVSILDAYRARKTTRHFDGTSMSLQQLSEVLLTALGNFHDSWDDEFKDAGLETTAVHRVPPTGGGLHPSRGHVVAFNVDGLDPGIYDYVADSHSLIRIGDAPSFSELTTMLSGQYYCRGIAAGVFVSSWIGLAAWKYGHSRAYRNVLLDVGHVSQTFLLTASSLGLETWLTGAFIDSHIEQALGLDTQTQPVFFFLGVGHGSGGAFDDLMKETVKGSSAID